MDVKQRQDIEHQIISKLVTDILDAGYAISVDDGGEEPAITKSTNHENIMASLMNTDKDQIIVHQQDGRLIGFVYLVYGNDGWDVINDYSTTLEDLGLLKGAEALADELEEKYG